MTAETPIARLIQDRMHQLGLTPEGLGARLGYRNPERAKGRFQALCDHRFTSQKSLSALTRLPEALGVPQVAIEAAVAETLALRAKMAEERRMTLEAEWRAGFKPHAVILTERFCPTQITICALTGGIDRWRVIPLNLTKSPLTFISQALAALPERVIVGEDGRRRVRFFDEALGVVVNYSPDRAVCFSIDGEPIEVLPAAYRLGKLEVSIGGRRLPPSDLKRITGGN